MESQGDHTVMTDEASHPEVTEQEIVRRYTMQLRQQTCGTRLRPADPSIRRCYELLNQCAMELAELGRRAGGGSTQPN